MKEKVKIMISTGGGAGLSTGNREYPNIHKDKEVIALVEADKGDEARKFLEDNYPDAFISGFNKDDIEIIELDAGTKYRIAEYDGSESVELADDVEGLEA